MNGMDVNLALIPTQILYRMHTRNKNLQKHYENVNSLDSHQVLHKRYIV